MVYRLPMSSPWFHCHITCCDFDLESNLDLEREKTTDASGLPQLALPLIDTSSCMGQRHPVEMAQESVHTEFRPLDMLWVQLVTLSDQCQFPVPGLSENHLNSVCITPLPSIKHTNLYFLHITMFAGFKPMFIEENFIEPSNIWATFRDSWNRESPFFLHGSIDSIAIFAWFRSINTSLLFSCYIVPFMVQSPANAW